MVRRLQLSDHRVMRRLIAPSDFEIATTWTSRETTSKVTNRNASNAAPVA
jgi:hypothetical protein